MYPVTLKLENKKCVVIGGGQIALRKAVSLIEAGADVVVISPEICDGFKTLQKKGKLQVYLKEVERNDYKDAFLIIAATNSKEVNEEVFNQAKFNQLVNIVSNQELANFHIPATFNRGKLSISVSTDGASPHLAKRIRNEIMEVYDESYEEYLDFLNEVRTLIKKSPFPATEKTRLLKESIDEQYKRSIKERNRFLMRLMPRDME